MCSANNIIHVKRAEGGKGHFLNNYYINSQVEGFVAIVANLQWFVLSIMLCTKHGEETPFPGTPTNS